MELIKTTVRLPKNIYINIKKKAAEEGTSVQELITNALDNELHINSLTNSTIIMRDAPGNRHTQGLKEIADKARDRKQHGPRDLSSNVDKYLY